jgi:pantothenate kinase
MNSPEASGRPPNSPVKEIATKAHGDAGQNANQVEALAQRIACLPQTSGRQMIAVAGAPASGKSTLALGLTEAVKSAGRSASIIPMDGFHLDNMELERRGLFARKGAPETFDAAGFIALMRRIKAGNEVVFPRFDRARDLAIAGADVIEADCDVAIVEGNYLLFDEPPWRSLAPLWDLSVWFDVPETVLIERCTHRWLDHDHSPEAAQARAEGNDLANARRIIRARLPADVTVTDEP